MRATDNKNRIRHGGNIFGKDVLYDLSVNINPAGAPDIVCEAVERAAEKTGRYPEYGSAGLKKSIAECFCIMPDEVVCGNGASELISVMGRVFEGKRLLLPVPSFVGYERAFCGSEISFYETDEKNSFDIGSGLAEAITESRPDAVIVGNPNNPTGRITDRDRLEDIIKAAVKTGCYVIVDESFIELSEGGETNSVINITKHYDNLIVLRSITKSFAVPGIRLGYMISSDHGIVRRVNRLLPEWNISVFADEVGKAIFEWGKREDYLARSRTIIGEKRNLLEINLKKRGIHFISSDCNFVLFRHDTDLYQKMLEQKILIRECSDYKGIGPGWFRMAVGEGSDSIVFLHLL